MRVVLDTNILVSACWKPGGLESTVVALAIGGQITACVSAAILEEYCEVLQRPKLAGVSTRACELLDGIRKTAITVEATARVNESVDDDDNRFLECAGEAAAEFLITGNLRHYPAVWGGARVVNARAFLTLAGFLPGAVSD